SQDIDPILAAMERNHSFHQDMANKILRDIADYKRIRSEYPDAASAPVGASAPPPSPVAKPAAPLPPPAPAMPLPELQTKSNGLSWRYEPFDGTFASLVRHYRVDSGSPYFKLQMK